MAAHVDLTQLNGAKVFIDLNTYDFAFENNGNSIILRVERSRLGYFIEGRIIVQESLSEIIAKSCLSWFPATVNVAPTSLTSGQYAFRKGYISSVDEIDNGYILLKTSKLQQVFRVEESYLSITTLMKVCPSDAAAFAQIKSELVAQGAGRPIFLHYNQHTGLSLDIKQPDSLAIQLSALQIPSTIRDFVILFEGQTGYLGIANHNPYTYEDGVVTWETEIDEPINIRVEVFPPLILT